MKITEHILWCGGIPYKFDKEDGEHVEGVTVRAVVLTRAEGNPQRIDIIKCAKDFTCPESDIGVPVTLLYDRFGRCVGYQV